MSEREQWGPVYLAGPMTGIPEFNFPAFREAARVMREVGGFLVVSPVEMDEARGFDGAGMAGDRSEMTTSYAECIGECLRAVATCRAVVVLPGWEGSQGAGLEVGVARGLGIPVYAYPSFERVPNPGVDGEGEPAVGPEGLVRVPGDDGRERVTSGTGGEKERRRARFDLLPWDALWTVAEVYGHGAEKYEPHNWRRGYDWSLSIGAAGRHLAKIAAGEDVDPESGLPHAGHLAFHALALLVFLREHQGLDDRVGASRPPWSVPAGAPAPLR